MKYYLTLDIEDVDSFDPEANYFDIKDKVELVWSGDCLEEEARERFQDLCSTQSKAFHDLKTIKEWRVIRLFDETGFQIAHEH